GYCPPKGSAPFQLKSKDSSERFCIEMYRLATHDVSLKNKKVLEIGSGRGGGANFLKEYFHPSSMVGIDLSADAVKLARQHHHAPGLTFQIGDAESLPFHDNLFDVVVNVESSHSYPHVDSFLRESYRVLRPGGHFCIVDFRKKDDLAQWRSAITDAGFVIDKERNITSGVVAALETDHERKKALIKKYVHPLLSTAFGQFAGLKGGIAHEEFSSGGMVYYAFLCHRPKAKESMAA
ncbi:MAG: class I SAM-dependent methyltransferase, partial [Alphaproteobacteria bacterium]|nr:class I SAM-dependent methyltransferase [Alphaproteobacteria bacterium]